MTSGPCCPLANMLVHQFKGDHEIVGGTSIRSCCWETWGHGRDSRSSSRSALLRAGCVESSLLTTSLAHSPWRGSEFCHLPP